MARARKIREALSQSMPLKTHINDRKRRSSKNDNEEYFCVPLISSRGSWLLIKSSKAMAKVFAYQVQEGLSLLLVLLLLSTQIAW